jgi:hypothetical protein
MNTNLLFEEKQYLGFNKHSLLRRLSMAVFCFICYYWNISKGLHPELFLILGGAILLISVILFFVLHLKTSVYEESIVLDGFWTTRKIKLNLNGIVSAEVVPYNRFYLNSPVYNLHLKGAIRFYTGGSEAIKLTDKEGLVYIIGSQKAKSFAEIIQKQLNSKSNQ